MLGRIHSFETFGSVDGPGVRFVIFFQGCHLRCRYCHNPDSWKLNAGKEYEALEIVKKAMRYQSYWGKDGGITASGGEALLQLDFLTELFTLFKAKGVNTCLDTAAGPFAPEDEAFMQRFDALMKVTDLVMLDIKHVDPIAHKKLTKCDNTNIIACARYLDSLGKDVWIRHVLVPGLSDDEASLKALGELVRSFGNVKRFEFLPYHSLGAFKWQQLGIPYSLEGVKTPSDQDLKRAYALSGL